MLSSLDNCMNIIVQAGPRICLGKEFAYRQMKVFASVLLSAFSFTLADERKPVHYRTMLTLQVDGGLHLRASFRGKCWNRVSTRVKGKMRFLTCPFRNVHSSCVGVYLIRLKKEWWVVPYIHDNLEHESNDALALLELKLKPNLKRIKSKWDENWENVVSVLIPKYIYWNTKRLQSKYRWST